MHGHMRQWKRDSLPLCYPHTALPGLRSRVGACASDSRRRRPWPCVSQTQGQNLADTQPTSLWLIAPGLVKFMMPVSLRSACISGSITHTSCCCRYQNDLVTQHPWLWLLHGHAHSPTSRVSCQLAGAVLTQLVGAKSTSTYHLDREGDQLWQHCHGVGDVNHLQPRTAQQSTMFDGTQHELN